MIKSFITKTRWLVTIILLTTLAVGQMWGAEGDNLYSGTFTGGTNYSYTLNQSLTISGKTWVISSSQKDNSQTKVFFLGCNSTHSNKGILAGTNNTNPNSGGIWDDVVTALRSASTWYNTNYATGHAYAMSMTANYNTVGKITVSWSGVGGPGFAYLFADTGSGLVKLTSGSYANGATTAGSLEYSNTDPGGINISRVVFVYRGGANENSGSTNKTIKITSVVIKEGKAAASCSAPTSPIKGSINASSQTVSWTAPASAPANGYLVAYSTATDQDPADNVYTTSGNYTVMAISAGTTTANIPCNSAGTYNWWVRSKCSADNSSLSSWVKGTAFTMSTLYLKTNSTWRADNAYFAAYFWDATTNGWTPAMSSQTDCETGVYKVVFPAAYTSMKFVRLNPAYGTPSFTEGHVWNETGNLTIPANKDCFTLPDGAGSGTGNGDGNANWSVYTRKYQIDFNLNKGGASFSTYPASAPDSRCVATGSTTAAPTDPVALGKVINGWYKESGCTNQWVFASQTVSANQELFANWEDVATKTIYLDASASLSGGNRWDQDGATDLVMFAHAYINNTGNPGLYYDVKMTAVSTCQPHVYSCAIPGNATHVSFARCASGTTELPVSWTNPPVYNQIAGKTVESGKNLYTITDWGAATLESSPFAPTSYTMSYAAGTTPNKGGAAIGGSKSSESKACDATYTLPSSAVFSVTGYRQTAWTTSDGGTQTHAFSGTYTTNADQAFYPVWAANTYQVAFNANGGGGSAMSNQSFTYDEAAKPLTSNTYTAPGEHKYFAGWATSSSRASAGTVDYTDGQSVSNLSSTHNATVTLYAVWKDHSYTNYRTNCCNLDAATNLEATVNSATEIGLTWDAPASTTGIDHMEVRNASTNAKIGSDLTTATTSATISGLTECTTYSFKVVSVGASCESTSNVVEAQPFRGAYTVTYNYHDGTGSPASATTACGSTSVTLPTPTKENYRFDGWYDAATSGTRKGGGGDSYTPDANITLHAYWTRVYTVTYAYDGGSGSCVDGSYAEGETVTVCASDPTKAGCDFNGWSYSPSVTVTTGTFPMPASNVTITATWEDHTYTLTHAGTGTKTNTENKTTIKSGDTPLTLHYTCTGTNAFPLNDVSISGGGKASWTRNTNFTWEVGSDKQTATLVITPATTITADVTITINMKTRYTVVWNEHGSTTTEYYASDDNSVEEKTGIADCGEKKFYCWTEDAEFVSDDDTPPAAATFGTISGNKTYYAIFADAAVPLSPGYVKVDNGNDIVSGTYMIASPSQSLAYAGQNSTNSYASVVKSISFADVGKTRIASLPSGAVNLTLTKISTNKFTLKETTGATPTEKYLKGNSSNEIVYIATSPSPEIDNNYYWQLADFEKDEVTTSGQIKNFNNDRFFRYNSTGSGRIAAYQTSASTSEVYLYKLETTTYSNYAKTCTLYDISITTPSGGTVETSPAAGTGVAGEGQTVTVTATPSSCKYLSALKYNDGSDHAISIASTPYTFTMPAADVTVTATFLNKSVSSIAPNTNTHRTLMQGTSFEGEQIRVTYNNGETEDLAWDDATLTFSGYNMSTLGNQTVTVTYTGCGTTTTTYSITITDGIPVTFSDCGITTLRKYDPGDEVPVESYNGAYACSGWEFAGWSETSVAANSTSFTPVRNFTASTSKTLYAVYAYLRVNGSSVVEYESADMVADLKEGARYVLAYFTNSNTGISAGLTGMTPTATGTYYLAGTSSFAGTEDKNASNSYVYHSTASIAANAHWQLMADGIGYWQLYNKSADKYLDLSGHTSGYIAVSSSKVGKLVIGNYTESVGDNDSRLEVKYNGCSDPHYVSWDRSNSRFNQYSSGKIFMLTKDESFSSNPPCAPRSVDFHGNGGQITEYGEDTDEGDPVELTITEASRDAGIRLPSARFADCNGKSWTFVGWSDEEIDVTRVPVLTTDLLEGGVAGAPHSIATDDEEYWAVFTNQGAAETKYGTISFTMSDFNKAYSSSEHTTTKTVSTMGDYTFGYVYVGHQSDVGIQFNEDAGELYNKTSLGKVNSISFTTFSSGDINKIKVYVGDEEKSTDHLLSAAEMQNVGSTWTYYPNDDESYVYITNVGKGNGSYVCVTGISIDFGKGTEVWATTPDCSIISLSGTVKVTSTSGQKVKATTPITVTGKDLTPSTALTFKAYNVSDDTENSNFTFVGSVNTDGSGNISSTTITVAYQPTATTDGIEEVYFRATDGTTNSNKLNGYGRHLPSKFLIATKVGDDWYALPNNTSSYDNPAAVKLSSVNESTGVATYYSDQYDGEAVGSKNYLTWTLNSVVSGSDANYGYTNHGNRVRFKDSKDNKYLEFGTGDDVGKIKNSRASSTPASVLHIASEILPTTSDLIDYTLQNEGQSKYLGVDGSKLWGAYAGSTTVRFLIPDQQPAATITWYNDMLGANHTTNKAENGVVTLPTGDDPESCNEPSGLLTFDGWVTATWTGYKTTGFTKVVGGEVATSNTTYYAVFKHATLDRWYTDCPTIYTITYTANGGTGADHLEYTMNTTADAITVGAAGFSKEGCTFVGWTNPDDVDGTIITPGAGKITGLTGDIILNAVWIGTTTVTGTVRLTASAGEKVATGATGVTISSTDLACATALRITYKDVTNDVTYGRSGTPSYTSSEFRLCDGSYGSADGSNISLAEVSGSYNQTFSITYEPNGGANTLDEYQLKVEVLLKNTVIDTKTLSLYGRTLPASFAIAIKIGGSWYALPNNMGSSGTYDPVLISVTEDASVLNWTAKGPSTVGYKMKDYTSNYSKLRFAADDATEYCLWAATGNEAGIRNYSASSTDANYAWTVTPDAYFNAYTMANLANTRTALKINDSKWQMYSSGGLSEIHFIPLTTVTPIDVTVMEWGADEIAVKTVANWTPSAITAQISGGSPSSVTKTSIGGDLYKLTGVGDLQGNPGEPLALNVTDGGAKQAIIQIPFIVTDTKTEADLADLLVTAGYADTRTNARNLTKNMDVIVRRNGTLSSESSVSGTFQNVYIYPGGKADFTKNISIQNLYMRGGFSWLGGAYAHPQMNVASTASITGIGSTGHGIFYDLYLDNSIYYVFALPKDVSVTTITNEENGDDWDAWIKSYSGEGRTLSPKVSGWSYVTSGSIARGAGYEIAIKPRLNRPYGILRFPLLKSTAWSTETDCTPSVTGWGANNIKVSDNNKGWNFIGNPFLTAYNNTATPGSSPGGLIQTKTLVPTDTDPWDGKYAWSTSAVKYFTVPRYTEYEYDDVRAYPYKLDAFFPFFIQATGDGTVTFDDANKTLKAPVRNAGEPVREVFVDFQLSSSNGQSDVAGLTISNQYSDAFDMNDKEKTIQNGNSAMKVYTLVGEFRTAFNALTEATAALPIPVGVIAPAAGTYRFTKLEDADYTEVEHLWLTDYTQSSLVDLLVEPFYEFTTVAGRIEDRFAINATLRPKHETTTGTEQLNAESEPPMKFIWQDKMYILRGGVIYDATGKKVKEINK